MPHIHKDIDYTADVFIVYRGRVLLRMHDKHRIWLAMGGHIELDEDPNRAAIREAKEEVGLDITLVGTIPTYTESPEYKELIAPRFMKSIPSPRHTATSASSTLLELSPMT